MNGNKILFIILFLVSSAFGQDLNIYSKYDQAINAYKTGQYLLAVQELESILSIGFESDELYYNLGNSYYNINDIAGSIWAYESALKLNPNFEDAKYNLKLSNLKIVDKVDLPQPPIYLNWYLIILQILSLNEWINITLSIILLYSILYCIGKIVNVNKFKLIKEPIIVLIICSSIFTLHSYWKNYSYNFGIIYNSKVEVRSEPNTYSTLLFTVHAGLKVSIKNNIDSWFEVELIDGKKGWVQKEKIRLID